jgi:hypothetical protein
MICPDHRRLDDLRRRLAGSENPQTIHDIRRAAARLAERTVIESIVRDCAVLVARCKAKARQYRASAKRAASAPKDTPVGGLCPQIAMVVTPWTKDERGNLTRQVFADPEAPTML